MTEIIVTDSHNTTVVSNPEPPAKVIVTGIPGPMGASGTIFLNVNRTEIAQAYYYYGGILGNSWQINKFSRPELQKTSANSVNNPTVPTLDAAWASKTTLTYS